MSRILKFCDFIKETYLKGSRAPLYRYFSPIYISEILINDTLKVRKPAAGIHGKSDERDKCICFTRNPGFSEHGNTRLVLDVDKMIKFGYKPVPFDEIGSAVYNFGKSENILKKLKTYNKVNPEWKVIKHKIPGLKTGEKTSFGYAGMEQEHEERVFKDIEKVGRFILYIDMPKNDSFYKNENNLLLYIKKYPHIIVREIDPENWKEPKNILLDYNKIINNHKLFLSL